MTVGYIPVPGTWGEKQRGLQWFQVGSPLDAYLKPQGLLNLCANAASPYGWSTDLDFDRGDHKAWEAGGEALFYYLVPQFDPIAEPFPPSQTVVISHSHGLQCVLYAASLGLKIDRLVDIAGPVRTDMMSIAAKARPNIRAWLHVYCPGLKDYMQLLGELFSGGQPHRRHPLADLNLGVPSVGHSGLLYDVPDFPLWQSRGLIDFLTDVPAPKVAA